MSVTAQLRHTRAHPCPICGGMERAPRGRGVRCFGFTDGDWCRCTREEYAGVLELESGSGAYVHRLTGSCRCGRDHATAPAPSAVPERLPRRQSGEPLPPGRLVERYIYEDPGGNPLHATARFDPKAFRQCRHVRGQWRWGLRDVQPVLYHLPRLLAAPRHAPVFVVEGERDVQRLEMLGLVATTNAMGAGKWRDHYARWLTARDVVIVQDNDRAGIVHGAQIARSLKGVARSVRIVRFAVHEGADISDWLDAGGSIEELLAELGYGRLEERA